ncbi:ammonia-forming cytochrome c nitrite reductase subunit c552 [Nigerium massiliense]|uniref:ammonia-forming cytochrome c nitrite reductase subunit c552 n=1 Tax=Nigerium massiliense TaxID=1522317 RepID=UPI000907D399|nr:ammonia-forming cytochrome c nitrite reductase subunit c552 [Nigerium massiliense]
MSSKATPEQPLSKKRRRNRIAWLIALGLIIGAVVTAAIAALLINVFQHRQESENPYFRVTNLDEKSFDPAVWGENFPLQYQGWRLTSQMQPDDQKTRTATDGDPRTVVAKSKLEADPRLVTMWQGYAFAVEYNEPRGHAYMLEDQRLVKRVTQFKQPGACLNCHTSLPEVLNSIGGDPAEAWATMNKTPYKEISKKANHPVSCIDCHDPKTMELRVTRPAFINGMKALKEGQGVKDYDVNRDATASEMRTFVCAQCHVEYYFKGDAKTLTFPWNNGLTIDDEFKYYNDIGFSDFQHRLTGANVVKAQHPDFETWSNGVHASAGVGCADCHMPYKREGAAKISDHQVRSPMINDETINASCLTCHRASEAEMKQRVQTIHDRYEHTKNVSFDALDALIKDIAAHKNNTPAAQLDAARLYQRKAQFYLDYVVSENSRGFHASAYTNRILNDVTDACRKGQLALRDPAVAAKAKDDVKVSPAPGTPSASASPNAPVTPQENANPSPTPTAAAPSATPSR